MDEIVRSMLTPDDAFQALKASPGQHQAKEVEMLLRRLQMQTAAAQADSQRAQATVDELEETVAGLEAEYQEKHQAFQSLLREHGDKQKLDRRVRQLDRTQRVTIGERQVLALLDQTRGEQAAANAQIRSQNEDLMVKIESLQERRQDRWSSFRDIMQAVERFQHYIIGTAASEHPGNGVASGAASDASDPASDVASDAGDAAAAASDVGDAGDADHADAMTDN